MTQLALYDDQVMTNHTSEYNTLTEPPSFNYLLNVSVPVSAKTVYSPVIPSIHRIATMMEIEPSPSYE
jgi:hypothetical protein